MESSTIFQGSVTYVVVPTPSGAAQCDSPTGLPASMEASLSGQLRDQPFARICDCADDAA